MDNDFVLVGGNIIASKDDKKHVTIMEVIVLFVMLFPFIILLPFIMIMIIIFAFSYVLMLLFPLLFIVDFCTG